MASPARPSSLPPVLCFLLLCPGFLWGAPLPHPISPHPFSNLFFSGLTWECCSRGHPPAPGCRKPAPQPLLQHDPSPGLWGPPFPCLLPSPPTAAAPSLSSFPPWHLLLFCLLLIRKNIFNGYISQSHMNAPFYVPSKEHSLQSGYDSSLFPSQSFRQQLGSREQEAGESWAAHPDLAQTPCGSRDFEMSSSRLRPVSDFR